MTLSTRRRRLLLAAGTGLLALVTVTPAIAGTGLGAVFNLGRTNTVNAPSTLTGKSSSPMLKLTNTGTGPALQLTTKTTVPPMKVNSSVKVANLNADKLDGLDSTDFLRPSGQILVQAGASSWLPFNSGDPLSATFYSSETQWSRSSVGPSFLSTSPDLPSVMFGKALQLDAVELCYNAYSSTSLTYVEINTQDSSTGAGERIMRFSDATPYSDAACHYYALSTPVVLTAETTANLFLEVNWTLAAAPFAITRATFVLEATSTDAIAPSAVVIKGDPIAAGTKSKLSTTPSK